MHSDSTARLCAWCKSPLIPHPNEKPKNFLKRGSCGPSCANKARWARDKERIDQKQCVVCGGDVPAFCRIPRQQRKRKTCSQSCKIKLANQTRYLSRVDPKKNCAVCGNQLVRRDGESPASFRLRKSCSDPCWRALISRQKINHHADIRATPYPPKFTEGLKLQVRRRDGFVCQECGCEELLHRAHAVHHIDYDKDNCEMSNLITLCQGCHVRTNWNRDYWMARFSV